MFYYSTHSIKNVETGNAWFIENNETSGSEVSQNGEIKEVRVQVPLTSTFTSSIVVPNVVEPLNNDEEQQINGHEVNNEPILEQPQEIVLRRSQRERKSAISNDYVVYLQESENDLGIDNDPVSFSEAINGDNYDKWLDAMKDELKSMTHNDVCDLMKLLEGCKRELGVNGSLRLNVTLMAISNVIRPNLLSKVLLKMMTLIIRKYFHPFLRKIPLELSWH